MDKIFAIYKPKGPTSRQVLNELQKATGIRKIGHAGTLDPLAKGVLVVGIGREATKKLHESVKKEKEYVAKIRLGMSSSTDDEEGAKKALSHRPLGEAGVKRKMLKNAKKAIFKFRGRIRQVPPVYSAVKIKGKEAYKLARRGEKPEMKAREVEIKEIEILKYKWPYLELRVVTGPGAYIRSLARDIGRELRVGGYLAELERVRVGNFNKKEAITVEEFKDKMC